MRVGEKDNSNNWIAYLMATNIAVLVTSVAGGAKLIQLPFGTTAAATVLSYAVTFAVTDVISEVYGRKQAQIAVRAGFFSMVLAVVFFQIFLWLPEAFEWPHQKAYETTLSMGARIVAGGLIAYLVSQHLDVHLFHWIKSKTGEKHLWMRNIGSTMISQLIDTLIFVTVAFTGVVPDDKLPKLIIGQYAVKLVIALLDTALVYVLVRWVRRTSR